MRKLTRAAVTLLSAASLLPVGVVVATSASAAPAAPAAVTCGAYSSITTSGGYARVRECFDGTKVRVNGTVKDTDADGQCARVYASYNGYTGTDYSPTACPENTTVTFTLPWRNGSDAFIYLQEI
jgi:hypothetical protein